LLTSSIPLILGEHIINRHSDPAEIREVSAAPGIISNFAGNRYYGYSGDGGSATVAEVAAPQRIAFDALGDLYIADQANHRSASC
jgi:hypothetical protein